jgi:hypothetical protein
LQKLKPVYRFALKILHLVIFLAEQLIGSGSGFEVEVILPWRSRKASASGGDCVAVATWALGTYRMLCMSDIMECGSISRRNDEFYVFEARN